MIPDFSASDVLPPFIGPNPAYPGAMSPYPAHMSEFAAKLATSEARVRLVRGLLRLRQELKAIGITQGVQLLDGSFCENVEARLGRPPSDIDVVTLLVVPQHWTAAEQRNVLASHPRVFRAAEAKAEFGCEHFLVNCSLPAAHVWRQITYWFGLFTHQRDTYQWKGIVCVPLNSDDDVAESALDRLVFPT